MNTSTLSATLETVDKEKEQFVEKFTPLVKRIAHHMMAKLPAAVKVDDLVQAGMVGLVEAIKHYNGSYGQKFESYAAQHIRITILEQLRGTDCLS